MSDRLRAGRVHRGVWEDVFENERDAYAWMAARLAESLGLERTFDAPIWCWHSCHGGGDDPTVRGAPPTSQTACDLFGVFSERDRLVMDLIELDVPDELVLLSSYSIWNQFFYGDEVPEGGWAGMFEEPLLTHEHDDIQAVIPWLEPGWVVSVEELVLRGDLPIPGTLRYRLWRAWWKLRN